MTSTAITTVSQAAGAVAHPLPTGGVPATITPGGGLLFDPVRFEHAQRVAKMFAASNLVPAHLRGNVADCAIALHMAERLNEDPLVVMQNINIINGRAGWSAQYMIGRANRSGLIRGRIRWAAAGTGDDLSVTAIATLADGDEEITATASMAMAKAEGWTRNSKYASMPEHMLRWRSATMLIRLYMPEIMLGIPTADEVEDVSYAVMPSDPPPRREDYFSAEQNHSRPHAPAIDHQPHPEADAGTADDGQEPADGMAYSLVTMDGEAISWPTGQEAHYVTGFITELRNAVKRGRAALDGLWESNTDGLQSAPIGVVKEVEAEHKRLLQGLSREEAKAKPAVKEPPKATKPADGLPPSAAGAPGVPPSASDDDPLF